MKRQAANLAGPLSLYRYKGFCAYLTRLLADKHMHSGENPSVKGARSASLSSLVMEILDVFGKTI